MKSLKKFTRGFTLIELLVVIAIIGILASIVLVSLNGARKKGSDARVISDVQEIRTALETGYNGSAYSDILNDNATNYTTTGSNYGNFSNIISPTGPDNTNINTLVSDARSQGGNVLIYGYYTSANTANGYAIYGNLVSNTSGYFCIDSTGNTIQDTANFYPATVGQATCH
jgi:prepilin-type N-terminal cleavage/methylation domain-containing protein